MLAVISASASASSGLLASMFRPPLENGFSRITCSTCKHVLSERSSAAHGRHAVCLEGPGVDDQEVDQEGHPKNPLSRSLKDFTSAGADGEGSDMASVDRPEKPGGDPGPGASAGAGGGGSDIASVDRPEKPGGDPGPGANAGAGGGGSDIASVDRPEKPGGDPGPGPMLLLWRDFTGCFDGLPPSFKATVLLALFTSPVTIPTAAVVSSWKLSKYTDTLVTKTYLDTKLDNLACKLETKLDKKLLPVYILGSYVGIVITGLALGLAFRGS
jgi:hypothetical protein